ncbi:hypothetical protein ACJX0J_008712 [Zea mays]
MLIRQQSSYSTRIATQTNLNEKQKHKRHDDLFTKIRRTEELDLFRRCNQIFMLFNADTAAAPGTAASQSHQRYAFSDLKSMHNPTTERIKLLCATGAFWAP